MLELEYKTVFHKHLKSCKRRGLDLTKLNDIVELLRKEKPLPQKNKNHQLKGNFVGYWECHIESDWLLLYIKTKKQLILCRTGTHSDIFG